MDPLGMKIYRNSILVPGCGGRHCPERGLGGKFVECCMREGIFFKLPFTVPTKISTLWFTDTCKQHHVWSSICSILCTVLRPSFAEAARRVHLRIHIIPQAVAALGWTGSAEDAEMQRARLVYFIICKSFKGLSTHLHFFPQHIFNACNSVNEETEAVVSTWRLGRDHQIPETGPHTFGNFVMFLTWCSVLWFKLMQYT